MSARPGDSHHRSVTNHPENQRSVPPAEYKSQIGLVIKLVLAVFFCEGVIMVILNFWSPFPPWLEVLIDSTALIILLSPVLYFMLFRSLVRHIKARRDAYEELNNYRNNLEKLVAERNQAIIAANKQLHQEINKHRKTEKVLRDRSLDLDSRIRELQCLYAISTVIQKTDTSYDDVIQKTVDLIRFAWLQPDTIGARVRLGQKSFETKNFRETDLIQASTIWNMGKSAGTLTVCRLEGRPAKDAISFSKTEKKLIDTVADQLGNVVQKDHTERELRQALKNSILWEKQITALLEGSSTVLENRDFRTVAPKIFEGCKESIGASGGYIALVDENGNYKEHLYLEKMGWPDMPGQSISKQVDRLQKEVYRNAKAAFRNDFSDLQSTGFLSRENPRIENLLLAPLIIDEGVVGILGLTNKSGGFTQRDVWISFAFAELASLAYLNNQTLESLEASEKRFRSVVQSASDAIVAIDDRENIIFWNNAAEKIFGYRSEEVHGKSIRLVMPKRFQAAHQSAMRRVQRTGQTRLTGKTLKMIGLRRDGNEFPLELTLAHWKTEQGLFFTAVIRDVSARVQAEQALRKKEENFRQMLENMVEARTRDLENANAQLKNQIDEREKAESKLAQSKFMLQSVFDGIADRLILVNKDMRIKMMNRNAVEYFSNKTLEDFIGKHCYEASGEESRCNDCEIPIAVKQGRQITLERKGFNEPDRLEKVTIYPLKDNGNKAGDAIIRITDITEKKQIENQLIQSEKLASLGVLVSSVAHEINNPNSFVTLNLPILRDYLDELLQIVDNVVSKKPDFELFNMRYSEFRKDIYKLLDNIDHGSNRISNFVTNLREFSQGREDKPLEWIDVSRVVENVVSICRPKINESFKTFNRSIQKDLPQIYTDPYAIEQVLINLVVNASQAADKKNSRLEISASNGESWRDHLVIEVRDNGRGMDENTRRNIFDPFFTTKPPEEGTGLGLYVCHNLIQELGGRIEVESDIGQGSTFRVILPDTERRSVPRSQDNTGTRRI